MESTVFIVCLLVVMQFEVFEVWTQGLVDNLVSVLFACQVSCCVKSGVGDYLLS